MRTVDDIASDFANANNDDERAALIREMDGLNAEIAATHLANEHATEYQQAIGYTRQSHRAGSNDAVRVLKRMERGEL